MDRTLQFLVALAAATVSAAAQGVTPTQPAAGTPGPITSTAPAPSAVAPAAGAQAASPGVSAEIASGLPGYAPEPTPKPGAAHAADKPRNQIVRLPLEVMRKYVVRERRLPVFRPLDLYTEKGLIDLSFKEHPGLRIGNFFNLNAPLAREAFFQEQLLAERDDLTDLAHAMSLGGDGSEGGAVQQAIIDESFEASGGEGGPVGLK